MSLLLVFTACGKSKAASEADALISSIGSVTLDSEESIIKAEKAVAELENKDKESLENLELLKSARTEYDKLVKAERIKTVDELIESIGSVTLDSEESIIKAEKAVAELENKDKESLENLELLNSARNEYNRLVEQECVISQLVSESWYEIYDGDEYKFNHDGTGTHGHLPITFEVKDDTIITVEGAAGTTKVSLKIVENNSRITLVPVGSESYYATKSDYDTISEGIRAEYTTELLGHEAWAVHKGSAFVMYLMFYKGGNGYALFTVGTYPMEWEFADNNTLKITITTNRSQSATYDIVLANGKYKLVSTADSNVVATPHN